jgi:hypothetical protein
MDSETIEKLEEEANDILFGCLIPYAMLSEADFLLTRSRKGNPSRYGKDYQDGNSSGEKKDNGKT